MSGDRKDCTTNILWDTPVPRPSECSKYLSMNESIGASKACLIGATDLSGRKKRTQGLNALFFFFNFCDITPQSTRTRCTSARNLHRRSHLVRCSSHDQRAVVRPAADVRSTQRIVCRYPHVVRCAHRESSAVVRDVETAVAIGTTDVENSGVRWVQGVHRARNWPQSALVADRSFHMIWHRQGDG